MVAPANAVLLAPDFSLNSLLLKDKDEKMKLEGYLTDTAKTHLNVEGFDYVADRPVAEGGENTGMSPHGYLLASIAGCKVMVAESYLRANGHVFKKVEVAAESDLRGRRREETIDIAVDMRVVGAELSEANVRHLNQFVESACPMGNLLTAGGKNTVTTNIVVE